MKEIHMVDQRAYKHSMEIPAKFWSKSRFSYLPRCDALAREKPIVSILEDIRVYLMNRWADNRQSILTYGGDILPKINKKFERKFDKGGEWMAIYAGRHKYELPSSQGNRDKFVVDLKNHEYSSRNFYLTSYPCEHAMSCIRKICLDVKNYVKNYYKKETYMDCYQHNDDVLPSVFRKPIEHPKLSRNKAGDEPQNTGPLLKLSRERQQQKCSYCFALGQNKRTYPRKCKVEASAKR
ncbi:hypothetical protein AHAS_Ahas14G0107300 [Arachis hypogaea]